MVDATQVDKFTRRGARKKELAESRRCFEKGLILTLVGVILVFGLSRRIPFRDGKRSGINAYVILTVDMVPVTRQGRVPLVPALPQVPIATEDEYLPVDETIETTELELFEDVPSFTETNEDFLVGEGIPVYQKKDNDAPKVVAGVVELNILVNEFGQVDSVRVLRNTTRSEDYEAQAIKTAYRTRYVIEDKKQQERHWIQRTFYFDGN